MTWDDVLETLVFIWPSLALAAGLAVAAGAAGVFVLLKRQGLAALALPQAVAVGVAVGLRMGWPTLPPAIVAAGLCILLVASTRSGARTDSLLAACYVGALALMILVVANTQQHLNEVQNRFVGIDVAVTEHQAYTITPALLALGLAVVLLWRRWALVSLTPAVAELAALSPIRWNAGFFTLLAGIVVLGTDSLGNVMVLALLFLPAATVLPWSKRIPVALIASALAGTAFLAGGIAVSAWYDWPLSQSVAAVGFAALVLSRLLGLGRS
jgi:ABC-type Mn2+/Zn2+ transport system permease subunit